MSNKFYLGKRYNLNKRETRDEIVEYNPNDLTTHAVITGMTGSGKTGLGLALLEESALQGYPAIIIDPKGDLVNLLLQFPELLEEDFAPWIDEDGATRRGMSLQSEAKRVRDEWRDGLLAWGIDKERLTELKQAVKYSVYTPGSDAGIPIGVLASLSAPNLPWDENAEILQEKISGIVTALLGLMGYDNIDPFTSNEHILICNIIESLWRNKQDVSIEQLIAYIQEPPFERLGAFSVEQFYPSSSRMRLAMKLNSFLASPSFVNWTKGEPLDIQRILYTESGEPKHSVFYLAHLDERERMFFVTMLYSSIESWMRSTKGSSGLRALVYFDEITGYLPPISNPSSKGVILRMLKHARAYGVGMVLASQNPVDLDYKALSNAGTWIVGKLQTEQDRRRLVSGIEDSSTTIDRKLLNEIISMLGDRIFMMHNTRDAVPTIFKSRWAMSYLSGPITRGRISELNKLAGVEYKQREVAQQRAIKAKAFTSTTLPVWYLGAEVDHKEACISVNSNDCPDQVYIAVSAKNHKPTGDRPVLLTVPSYAMIDIPQEEFLEYGVLWTPYYRFFIDGENILVPAFKEMEELCLS